MLTVKVKKDTLHVGEGFTLSFERTLRLPDDGKTYPLPPSLGHFPICQVNDYRETVPEHWRRHGGMFIPMYQREAMWIRFQARYWKPNAVKIAVGQVNAISGQPWHQALTAEDRDYMVCPPQIWLDGINAGADCIRQFVAMPLGMGYTVEGQVTGQEEAGGIQIIVYQARPGIFPDKPPRRRQPHQQTTVFKSSMPFMLAGAVGGREMGLAAGGKMRQKIYPDPHGVETWDPDNTGRAVVHIVNSLMYREITGKNPPSTPVTAQTYARNSLPWFDLYDESLGDIAPPDRLLAVKSVKEMDADHGLTPQQDDSTVEVPDDKIITYPHHSDPDNITDRDW